MSAPEEILIRLAVPEEANVLSDIAFRSKSSHGYSREFMDACREELTYTFEQVASDDFHFVAADVDGQCIGFAALEVLSGEQCELEALFVHPEYTGKGVGKTLMNHVMRWARKNRIVAIQIQSDPEAESFYTGMGAKKVGECPSGSIPGRLLPRLKLEISRGSDQECHQR